MTGGVRGFLRRLRFALTEPPVDRVPRRWAGAVPDCTGRRVCIFVTYARDGIVPEHARIHYRGWTAAGFDVVLVACLDRLDAGLRHGVDDVAGLLLRANRGYDFGAWANAIVDLPTLSAARLCVIANDSVYGPLHDLATVADRMVATGADFVGLVGSTEHIDHYQSFLLAFTPRAMTGRFWRFWRRVREGGREQVIEHYELRLLHRARRAGLKTAVLHGGSSAANPTLSDWRALVADGFPYLKVQLLRDNPRQVPLTGWRTVMADHGYDPAIVDRHLGDRAPL
jgi:lipopolysaccharide biosynthesis protein